MSVCVYTLTGRKSATLSPIGLFREDMIMAGCCFVFAVVTVGRLAEATDDVTTGAERGAVATMVGSTLSTGVEVAMGCSFRLKGCNTHKHHCIPFNQNEHANTGDTKKKLHFPQTLTAALSDMGVTMSM